MPVVEDVKLSAVMQNFVVHWGEMGTRWGINRTVAQIHALLYLWPEPLNAEQIAKTLNVARSNVSTSLRELQSWGIVRVVHVLGDRRDHFVSMKDVWEMFQIVLDERKRREMDPTLALLRESLDSAKKNKDETEYTRERIAEMLNFFETMSNWYQSIRKMPTGQVIRLVQMGEKLRKLVDTTS